MRREKFFSFLIAVLLIFSCGIAIFYFFSGEKVAKIMEFNQTPQSYGGTSFKFLPTEKFDYRYKYIIFAEKLNGYQAWQYLEAHPGKGDYPGDAIIKGKDYDGDYAYIIFSNNPPDNKFIPKCEWIKK